MQVTLYKKYGSYTDQKTQKKKLYVNFYLQINDQLIPVELVYFKNPKCQDHDPNYAGRKGMLEAFATLLPDRPDNSVEENADVVSQPVNFPEQDASM